MINFPNNGHLIQDISELPVLASYQQVYLDFETTSGDDKISSTNPWYHCEVLGVCICVDDNPHAYYVPLAHRNPTPFTPNLDKSTVSAWLQEIIRCCSRIIGQNIKYDLHVMHNSLGIDYRKYVDQIYDTLTQAKLYDSDRLDYSLSGLSKDLLGKNIDRYDQAVKAYLIDGRGNTICQDYAQVPARVLGEYGCQDVLTTRELHHFLKNSISSDQIVIDNELSLTNVLFDMECTGMRVNPTQVVVKKLQTLQRLENIIYEIIELAGEEMRPHTSDDCYEFLCVRNGLPVLGWTNEDDDDKQSNPSFNKETLQSYLAHPRVIADTTLMRCVELIGEYRVLNTFNSLFLSTYQKLAIPDTVSINGSAGGTLHPTFNQCVRTGRLSCSQPNFQQLSKLAKELLIPPEGFLVVDIDLSQIEFRLIASAINNLDIINAYNTDPRTDYHDLIAKMANLARDPAKAVNFAIGFGAGEPKTIKMIRGSLNLSSKGFQDSELDFDTYCEARARHVYTSYHRMLPELKPTQKQASNIARARGYIANLYGRHRKLGSKGAFKAFNAYIQSSAADIAKSITLKIAKVCDDNCKLVNVVHDSWIFYMHQSVFRQYVTNIVEIIENETPPKTLRVPIRCKVKISPNNWKECKKL